MSNGSRSSSNSGHASAQILRNNRRSVLTFFRGPKFDYDVEERRCWCNPSLRAPMWFSWSDSNPGRRFFNCPNEPENGQCRFFEWYNEPLSRHGVEVINGLLREKALYRNEIRRLMNDGCQHCRVRIVALGDVITEVKKEVKDLEGRLAKGKQKLQVTRLSLILPIVFCIWLLTVKTR